MNNGVWLQNGRVTAFIIAGVDITGDCEGAPVYQIFFKAFFVTEKYLLGFLVRQFRNNHINYVYSSYCVIYTKCILRYKLQKEDSCRWINGNDSVYSCNQFYFLIFIKGVLSLWNRKK